MKIKCFGFLSSIRKKIGMKDQRKKKIHLNSRPPLLNINQKFINIFDNDGKL